MRKILVLSATLTLASFGVSAQPELNDVFFFYDSASLTDNNPGAVPEPAFVGQDIRGVDYNPATDHVIVSEDDNDRFFVCNANTGAVLATVEGVATGDGIVDPYGIAVSDDGVVFVHGFSRTIHYFEDETGAVSGELIAGASVAGGVGSSRDIHVTGSVAAGTARVFIGADSVVSVIDVSGTAGSREGTEITTWTTNLGDIHGIGGDASTVLLGEISGGATDAAVVVDGGDTIIPSADDTYTPDGALAANQLGGGSAVRSGVSALTNPEVDLAPGTFTQKGAFAIVETGGSTDGVFIASLGAPGASGEAVVVSAEEDWEPDGFWDGEAVSGGDWDGGNADGSIDLAERNGEVWAYVTTAGLLGGFGGFNVPGSIPVELSVFTTE